MFCIRCGAQLGDGFAFCPNCGAKNDFLPMGDPPVIHVPQAFTPAPDVPEPDVQPVAEPQDDAPTQLLDAVNDAPQDDAPTQLLDAVNDAPQDDAPTQLLDTAYDAPQAEIPAQDAALQPAAAEDDPMTTPLYTGDPAADMQAGYENAAYGQPAYEPWQPETANAYGVQPEASYGYPDAAPVQPTAPKAPKAKKAKKNYPKTPVGLKILCIFLCLMIFLFGSIAVTLGSIRIGLSESNVRDACREGSIADITFRTDKGEKTLTDIIAAKIVDDDGVKGQVERLKIRQVLEKASVRAFIENAAVEYQRLLFDGTTPINLNAEAIGSFLEGISDDFREETGYELSPAFIRGVKNDINGGDLSILSIDATGGSFKMKYGVDLRDISMVFSLWTMIAVIVVTVIFMGLIFLINLKRPAAAFSFNGVTLIVLGGVKVLIAAAIFVLSTLDDIYLVSSLLQSLAIGFGIVGASVLVFGVIMLIVKSIIKKRSAAKQN